MAGVLTVCETIAVAVQLQDVDVMGRPVEQRASQPFGAEDLGPFVEGQIRGHERRRLLVAALVHGATRQGWSKGSDDAVMS